MVGRDLAATSRTGHSGSDGSGAAERMNRYGQFFQVGGICAMYARYVVWYVVGGTWDAVIRCATAKQDKRRHSCLFSGYPVTRDIACRK